ncbi:S-layer homology domain-containing protein [bacterium]|nr:S-layer homology domain-containing protein [bacterium]
MDIKGDWKKRAVSGLMVLVMALSLLPTSILAADTRSVTDNAIKNGSFEEPAFHDKNSPQWPANNVPDWDTTASDKLIEFGSRRNGKNAPQLTGVDKTIPDGSQFAELNADEESTLYQYAETVGGNVYEWGLSHRGRDGVDQMAVIIGPKQDDDPDKPSADGKDQFMRMTDWVRQHASEMGVTVYNNTGCTQKITVYSKKFAKKGGFQNDIGDAFSASPSDVYTEKWNVWIIGTNNNAWGNYGTKSSDYAEGNLAYSCRYAVPDGQSKTVFAFCSYSAAGGSTCGNLIDNIHFSLYQTITAAATAGGSGYIGVPTGNESVLYKIDDKMRELVVANGSTITVQAVEPKNDVQFVGAYVTRQTQNGLKKEFIPAASSSWDKVDRTYTYVHPVEEPADIVLVFVKKPMVIYEANGGDQYTHGDNGTNAVSFAQQVRDDGSKTERLPYESQEATTKTKDGWRFDGWLLARKEKVLPAVHTVSYDTASETFTFTADDGTKETLESGGATLIAQWKWRQRFVTASRVKDKDGMVSADIQENTACGSITVTSDGAAVKTETTEAVTDYYSQANEKITATATAKNGYRFVGWYQQLDGDTYQFISNQETYTYTAKAEGVQTVYARFAPTHTVTYQWASVDAGKCPPNRPEPPSPGTVIDGGTYYISKDFIKDKTTIDGTVTKDGRTVPGKWVFTGWRSGESGDSDIRETELIKVTGDRTLTGFWTFIPEKEHTLTYQFADNNRWSPSGSFAQTENHYRGESVTAKAEPDHNKTTDEEGNPIDVLVTGNNVVLYGKWSFDGWKRSDNDSTIAAGRGFNMPGKDLTLTGQWEFTPYTYTVVYDLVNGRTVADLNNKNYNYSKLLGSSKPGLNALSTGIGIPFGASIELMELPAGTEIPDDKYFAGWSLVEPTSDNLDTIQTQDPGDSVGYRKLGITENGQEVKLYAVYKDKDVATVDFAVNDSNWGDVNPKSGSFMVQNGKVDEGTVSSTAAPRDGYHFVGWYEESDDGKLEPVNGSAISGTTLTVTAAMMQAKLKPLAESRGENRTPVLEVRYIAVFARDSFTVEFNRNGDDVTGEMPPQKFHDPNSKDQPTMLRKNEFKRRGYVFTGWAEYPTRGEGQGRTYADEAPFAEVTKYRGVKIVDGDSITLYAQWEKLPDVTISYTPEPTSLGTVELNGTAAKGNDTITVQEGTVYEKLNPETGTARGATAVPGKGSVFVGWYDAQDTERSHPLTDGSTTYTPEKEDSSGRYQKGSYVALFRLKQYVLHYDANAADAVGTMKDQTFPHGQAHPLEKCAFSREGYRFVGWATGPAGEVKYEDQKSIKLDEEFKNLTNDNDVVTLYAVWEEQSVTIGYEPNDAELGSVSSALETVAAVTGTAKGSTAQAKSGARFDGWYSADGTLLSTELTFVPKKADGAVWQGTTYYAHFSAQRRPSTPSTPAKPDETKPTLAPIPEMLNGEDHYAYLLGYEDGTVRPNGSISRAEVATVLFRLLKDDVRMQNLTKDNAYSDVSDTAWYAAAVSTLSKMGVISGYPDGTFRPNAPITRAEFAAMIARFDDTAKSADTPFTDISGHWAENAIGKAYGNGWVEGSSKTVFCPESNLTRAETATLLNRVLHRLPEKESDLLANQIVWPDNPETFWGYLAIQEATNSHEYERKADGVHETQTAKRENRDWSKEFEQ